MRAWVWVGLVIGGLGVLWVATDRPLPESLAWVRRVMPARPAWVTQSLPDAPAWAKPAPETLYRWKDADGRVTYGNKAPDGVKAEVVADRGKVSTVPATPVPIKIFSSESHEPTEPGPTLQQQVIDRAIKQASGG